MARTRDGGGEDSRVPLWRRVQDHLRGRIAQDEFAAGIPGELALAREYQVSRSTIRSALGPLRREGLVSSQRGRPSTVSNLGGAHRFGPVYSLFAAVENIGMTQRSVVDRAELLTDAAAAARLGLDPAAELVFISRTRYADDEVIAVDDTWLPAAVAEPVLHADLSHTALYQVLRERCGVTLSGGRETLHAVALDEGQAARLSCPVGTAAFFIDRIGLVDAVPVEWRNTLIRGDRFTVDTSYPEN